MKIGILTQPLHNNYGGILQAYALQKVLKDMGHEVWTVDIPFRKTPIYIKILSIIKRILIKYVLGKKTVVRTWPTKKEEQIISQNTRKFINDYIKSTEPIFVGKIHELNKYNFDAYIVGSDQVWRPKYSPHLPYFFLSFLINNDVIKRIAYAASFGTEEWELNKKETEIAKENISKFNSISVREESGIILCKDHLNVKAELVLDPTLLLTKEDYINQFNLSEDNNDNEMLIYVLDKTKFKTECIKAISKHLKLNTFATTPKYKFGEVSAKKSHIMIFPPVTEWIQGFKSAQFVITDSFHGTVFSIIFNKPFLVIGNESRGLSRFKSLLKIFNLEDRLISEKTGLNTIMQLSKKEIDFNEVNKTLQMWRKKSFNYLVNNL
jgi:hypothetical protein